MTLGEARARAAWVGRRMAITAALALVLCVAACATTARSTPEWVKTRESAEDLDSAREACKQQALAEVADEYRGSIGAQAGAGSFFKCMARKGWKQAPRGDATPTTP